MKTDREIEDDFVDVSLLVHMINTTCRNCNGLPVCCFRMTGFARVS